MTVNPTRSARPGNQPFRHARTRCLLLGAVCLAASTVALASLPAAAAVVPEAPWNTVVALTFDGELVLFDTSGREVDRIDTGRGSHVLRMIGPAADRVVVYDDDASQLLIVDPSTGEIDEFDVPEESAITAARGSEDILVAGPTTGGANVVVVNVLARTSADFSELTMAGDKPLFLATSVVAGADGMRVAITEEASSSTIVALLDGTTPFTVAGRPIGFSGRHLVTIETEGTSQNILFSDANDGIPVQSIPAARLVRAAVLSDGSVAAVDADGSIMRFDAARGAPLALGAITPDDRLATYVGPTSSGFVVVTSNAAQFFALDGTAAGAVTIASDYTVVPADARQRCLTLSARPKTTAILDVEDRVVIAETAGGPVAAVSDDGCTVVVLGDQVTIAGRGTQAHGRNGLTLPERWKVSALSADGTTVVARGPDRITRVIDVGEAQPGDPTAGSVVLGEGEEFARTAFVG